MPAACSLSSRLSTRKASITMSCVAEAVATRSAPTATSQGAAAGSHRPRNTIAAISRICENTSQPRRRPSQRDSMRHVERIDQRRPQEFHRVGRADQREQPDGAEIDAGLAHPHQQRRAGQRQRQARREAEEQNDQHARLEIDRERLAPAGFCGGFVGVAVICFEASPVMPQPFGVIPATRAERANPESITPVCMTFALGLWIPDRRFAASGMTEQSMTTS